MKNTFLLLLLVLSALTSCIRVDLFPEDKIYLKFSQEDYKFIPQKYKQKDVVHNFISNSGQNITLQNNNYNIYEEVVYQSMTKTIYYDNAFISLKWNALTECNDITIKISKSSDNGLMYIMEFYSKDFGCSGSTQAFNSTQTFTQMQVGGTIYNYVKVFELNNKLINVTSSKKINKIYYDMEKGFVGFENTQTNEQYWTN